MPADLITQLILPISLFIIMLGLGLSLKISDFAQILKMPQAVALGLASQLLLLPVLAFIVIFLFGLTKELAVGLLIISLCPGGTTSNMLTYLAKGDVALSITLTSLVSIITPLTLPLLTLFAVTHFMGDTATVELPVLKTMVQLIVMTLVPVVLGMIIYHKRPVWAAQLEQPIKYSSIGFLFIIILGIVLKNKAAMFGFFMETGLATLTLNILAIASGWGLAKILGFSKSVGITLGIEVGIQNGTVALFVAGTLLENPLITIPAITYSLMMFITGGLFGVLMNRHH